MTTSSPTERVLALPRQDFGTIGTPGSPAVTMAQRTSRCLELTATALLNLSDTYGDATYWRLVHGGWESNEGFSTDGPIGHAWLWNVVTDERWEPILCRVIPGTLWDEWVTTYVERVYDTTEALALIGSNFHYGVWHDSLYRYGSAPADA